MPRLSFGRAYPRLIDPPRGVEADRPQLLEIPGPLLFAGAEMLLAGSADAGLAECVLEAARGQPVAITVVDLCETPLRQCATLLDGRAESGRVTRQATIAGPPVAPRVDFVLGHSILPFLTPDEVPRAGTFFRDSLRAGGRLVRATALRAAAAPSRLSRLPAPR
jgi:hypothetical protein